MTDAPKNHSKKPVIEVTKDPHEEHSYTVTVKELSEFASTRRDYKFKVRLDKRRAEIRSITLCYGYGESTTIYASWLHALHTFLNELTHRGWKL